MAEPTSTLTFSNLILETAIKAGMAYYGVAGDEAAQVPIDAHDLAECKRHVNNAIRMFMSDAPPTGWRWTRPTASVALWPSVAVTAGRTVVGVHLAGVTTLTANAAVFYPSMEGKSIVITGVGTFTLLAYTSATAMTLTGNATTAGATFSITADGDYTLPQTFGGEYTGGITYAAATNRAGGIEWTSDTAIRQMRENVTAESGPPRWASVRIRPDRRRWEIMFWPVPDELITIQFSYDLYFDSLVNLTDLPPSPYIFDEAVKSACRSIVERDINEELGVDWSYYQEKALPQAFSKDMRTAPAKIGYFSDPSTHRITPWNYRDFRNRPNVTFTP